MRERRGRPGVGGGPCLECSPAGMSNTWGPASRRREIAQGEDGFGGKGMAHQLCSGGRWAAHTLGTCLLLALDLVAQLEEEDRVVLVGHRRLGADVEAHQDFVVASFERNIRERELQSAWQSPAIQLHTTSFLQNGNNPLKRAHEARRGKREAAYRRCRKRRRRGRGRRKWSRHCGPPCR